VKPQNEALSATPIDPTFSSDASFIAFIRYNDLWIHHLESGKEIRLTYSNPGMTNFVVVVVVVNVVELQRSSQIELKIRLNRFDSNKFEL
jgi:hypothetical protein